MNKTLKIKTIALAATAALVLPSAALANSSQEGYGGPNNVVAGIEETGTPPPTVSAVADETASSPVAAPVAESSSLPFTGADLGILAAAGALMLMLGFGLRRVTRQTQA